MFSYFGSKSKLLDLYPPPVYGKVHERFAGSARYACKYHDRDVWINDPYPVIYEIWLYIQQATAKDIRSLPMLRKGESIQDCKQLCREEKLLLGFAGAIGLAKPAKKIHGRSAQCDRLGLMKRNLLGIVGKIGHWKITCDSYDENCPNVPACWFLDPPYQTMGHHYAHGSKGIDYDALGKWCRERKGQVIVCEGRDADWLPFQVLKTFDNQLHNSKRDTIYQELIWYRCDRKVGFGIL